MAVSRSHTVIGAQRLVTGSSASVSNTSVRRWSVDSRTNSTLISGPSSRQSPTGRSPGLQMRAPQPRHTITWRSYQPGTGRDQRESHHASAEDDVVEDGRGVSRGAAAEHAPGPQSGTHLDGRTHPGFEYYVGVIARLFGSACVYGQVLKTRRNDRVVRVERRRPGWPSDAPAGACSVRSPRTCRWRRRAEGAKRAAPSGERGAERVALLLLPMNVQSSSACSSMISKSRNIRWLKRFAAVEARSSHRARGLRAWPVTRAVADMLTPSTRRLATWSNSLRAQRRPLYAVPVFVLTVPPQTVQRYRQRRPHFVGNEPWPTMLRPSFRLYPSFPTNELR